MMHQSSSLPTKPHSQALGLPANGILRIYNQFPRCYRDINEMASQLPSIAAMGFNVVWINPIQETGKEKHPLKQDPLGKGENAYAYSGSLYATRDTEKIDDAFSTNKPGNQKNNRHDMEALKNYTQTAKNCGLTPIFDLVLNQVAIDAEIYLKHKEWFIHPSHHFGPFCCDFNYAYSDPTVFSEIIQFLKTEICKYIVTF
jgi:alpha-amylase